jgi:hypothetical protein
MKRYIMAILGVMILVGGSTPIYREPHETNMLDPDTVSCQDRSDDIDYDPSLDIPVVPAEPEIMPRRDMQLALARICVSEAGFQVRTNDCTMIYHALRTRSNTGEITIGIMRAYAPRSFNMSRTDNHRWVAHLRSDFREPRGWRETVSIPWSTRREGFQQVYEHAGMLLRTHPENPCGIRIDHWGARYFRRNRHIRNGWTPITCGETLNQFWSLPD